MAFDKINKFLNKIRHIGDNRINIANILEENKNGSYFILFFMTVLTFIPTPAPIPIISSLISILCIILSFQIMINKSDIFLPKFFKNLSIERKTLDKIVKRINPYLIRLETVTKKRIRFIFSKNGLILLNTFLFLLSANLFIPLPITNMIPAMSIMIIVFGVLNNDGLFVLIGLLIGMLSFLITFRLLMFYKYLIKSTIIKI